MADNPDYVTLLLHRSSWRTHTWEYQTQPQWWLVAHMRYRSATDGYEPIRMSGKLTYKNALTMLRVWSVKKGLEARLPPPAQEHLSESD